MMFAQKGYILQRIKKIIIILMKLSKIFGSFIFLYYICSVKLK